MECIESGSDGGWVLSGGSTDSGDGGLTGHQGRLCCQGEIDLPGLLQVTPLLV